MCIQKMRAQSYIGAEKIKFPPKPDIQTDIQTCRHKDMQTYRHTYRRTYNSVYRVASLLKINKNVLNSKLLFISILLFLYP